MDTDKYDIDGFGPLTSSRQASAFWHFEELTVNGWTLNVLCNKAKIGLATKCRLVKTRLKSAFIFVKPCRLTKLESRRLAEPTAIATTTS